MKWMASCILYSCWNSASSGTRLPPSVPVWVCYLDIYLDWPAANLFLIREKRYPGPASSMSQPDSVLPSLVNCTASGAGLLGPSVSWKRASSDPTPGRKWKTEVRCHMKKSGWRWRDKNLPLTSPDCSSVVAMFFFYFFFFIRIYFRIS